jgi:hypothetical protein
MMSGTANADNDIVLNNAPPQNVDTQSPSSSLPFGFLKTTRLSPMSQSVRQVANGSTTSHSLGLTTSFTGASNCSSSSSQCLSHMRCGVGSIRTTYRSRSPVIPAMIAHPRVQFAESSWYARRCAGPRRRYGRARMAQRRRSVRILFMRCGGRRVGR